MSEPTAHPAVVRRARQPRTPSVLIDRRALALVTRPAALQLHLDVLEIFREAQRIGRSP
jgi:hypothetical protein